ncbi:predicted protein [Paecilomyces variotii No. 5]|uniref:Uncharacterized protein n=1 Tax=Byssochlamys spectabilis (strain No. 5 / NBRC 109023) TaxID=1356009 RepID=V5GAM9_BYSSN|nr:predicted protein [Paecilomyces variotii No. 5]
MQNMEWSLDFCLVCDRQTCGGAYCSQACRLAELDGFSTGSSLSSQILSGKQTSLEHPSTLASAGRQSPETGSVEKSSTPRFQLVDTTAGLSQSTRTLSPSSSETSLTSLQSNSSRSTTVSDQVWNELCDYASCFDHVRDWRRRLAVS